MCVKSLTTWLEIVLGVAEVPGPQRLSFFIGANDRATLHEIARGRVFSARHHLNGALPAVSVQIDGVRCTALVDSGCTQTMLSDVEEKASPLAGCRRELVNVLWRERGPNWHRQ